MTMVVVKWWGVEGESGLLIRLLIGAWLVGLYGYPTTGKRNRHAWN